MAGTRLRVVITFLVPFVAWVVLCILAGLDSDLLLLRIAVRTHPARIALQEQTIRNHSSAAVPPEDGNAGSVTTTMFPAVTLVTADSQVVFWEPAVRKLAKVHGDHVRVVAATNREQFRRICDDPSTAADAVLAETTSNMDGAGFGYDIWVCEFWIPRENPRLVISGNTTVFYPTSLQKRISELKSIYPMTMSNKHQRLVYLLLLDKAVENWKVYMNIVQDWIQRHDFGPCMDDRVDLEIQRSDMLANRKVNQSNHILTTAVPDSLFSSGDNDTTLRVVLYIPVQSTLLIDELGATSTQAAFKNVSFFSVVNDWNISLESSLHASRDRLLARCFGLPMDDPLVSIETSNVLAPPTIPSFYTTLYYARALQSQYQALAEKAETVRSVLLALPTTVLIDAKVTSKYGSALAALASAKQCMSLGNFRKAAVQLERTDTLLQALRTDPSLADPTDFPTEQYMAIFGPLLVPILVPLLMSLIREHRRYRKLIQKRLTPGMTFDKAVG